MRDAGGGGHSAGRQAGPTERLQRRGADRRQRRRLFVLQERRTGFDRRISSSRGSVERVLLTLRDHPPVLAGLLIAANILNLLDFLMTHRALQSGVGEANPVMNGLFSVSPWAAGVFKLTVVGLSSLAIWRFRRYRRLLVASMFLVAAYSAVILFQLYGLAVILD